MTSIYISSMNIMAGIHTETKLLKKKKKILIIVKVNEKFSL